jgi:hypothetical protein
VTAAEKTGEVDLRVLHGLAYDLHDEGTVDEEELTVADIDQLLRGLEAANAKLDSVADRITRIEATSVHAAKVTALEIKVASLEGMLRVGGAVLAVVGTAGVGLALAALFGGGAG